MDALSPSFTEKMKEGVPKGKGEICFRKVRRLQAGDFVAAEKLTMWASPAAESLILSVRFPVKLEFHACDNERRETNGLNVILTTTLSHWRA
jgi:hypothetical protein